MPIKMNPGLYLACASIADLIIGFANLYWKWFNMELLTMAYCVILSLPLWIPPISKWVGVRLFWRM